MPYEYTGTMCIIILSDTSILVKKCQSKYIVIEMNMPNIIFLKVYIIDVYMSYYFIILYAYNVQIL